MPHSSSSYILRVQPKELNFPPPFNRVITSLLNIQNTSPDHAVAYKVKTTAPQRYCVRPNTGVLPPGDSVEVQVLLNHTKDSPPSVDGEDKFQIQSIILKDSFTDIKEVWAKAPADQVIKQKLKAKFTLPTSKGSSREEPTERPPLDDHLIKGDEIHTTRSAPVVTFALPPQTERPAEVRTPHKHETPATEFSTPNLSSITPTISSPTPLPSTPQSTTTRPASGSMVDVHANLRKALDQVVTLTSEKENYTTQNRELSQQVANLQKIVKDLQDRVSTSESTGLRQRSTVTTPSTSTTSNITQQQQANNINKQILILVVVVIVAFLIGRWTA